MNSALGAVIANGFNGAAFFGLFALSLFLGGGGLFENERIAAVVVTGEVFRGRLPAQVTIDTLVIDVELATGVFGVFVCYVSHK